MRMIARDFCFWTSFFSSVADFAMFTLICVGVWLAPHCWGWDPRVALYRSMMGSQKVLFTRIQASKLLSWTVERRAWICITRGKFGTRGDKDTSICGCSSGMTGRGSKKAQLMFKLPWLTETPSKWLMLKCIAYTQVTRCLSISSSFDPRESIAWQSEAEVHSIPWPKGRGIAIGSLTTLISSKSGSLSRFALPKKVDPAPSTPARESETLWVVALRCSKVLSLAFKVWMRTRTNENKDFAKEFVGVHSRHNPGKTITQVTNEDSLLFIINSRFDVTNDGEKPL